MTPPQQPITILLVDDDARNLDALEAILADPGYRLIRALDADSALRQLLENDVAAIVLDIKMPGVSGFELAGLIKGTKKFRQIPLLFLTAYMVDEKDVLTGYVSGAVDYLTKPVNPAILRHKVAVYAELFRKTRALAELNDRLEARVMERTAELARSEAALRDADAQKDRFLATLAHELRNPLAPLRTGLDLLLRSPDRPANSERVLGAMNRQLDHMVRLLDDLLDIARITRGTLEVRKELVDLASVIQRAVEMTSPHLVRRNQSVAFSWGDAPLSVQVDPTRIAQIVANLLNNASKHSPAGARVTIRTQSSAEGVSIQVIDEGAGIAADRLPRVFEMFTKIESDSPHPNDGLGIGLALSKSLARLHGGTLTAESAGPGKGSTFTLTIPGRAPEAVAQVVTPPATEAAVGKGSSGSLRIVVVEDNEDSAEMLSTWLEFLGHHAIVARDGLQGVSVIKQSHPDVVLCDIGLPGMNGVDVCKQVVGEMPSPPVMVALTGWGAEGDRARTEAAGFRHHLVKPVDLDKLRAVLESIRGSSGTAVSAGA